MKNKINFTRDSVTDMPSSFLQTSENHFRVCKDVSSEEILNAAELILKSKLNFSRIVWNQTHIVKQYVKLLLSRKPMEIFCVAFLDNQLKLIHFEKMFRGSLNEISVYPREIAKRALELNAASLILVHNHPSGHSAPSIQDEYLTNELSRVFKIFDIKIVDHLIVGGDDVFSFAENGKLDCLS